MFVYFVGIKFSWILLIIFIIIHDNLSSFLYIIMMFKVYICSTWFLNIRISICFAHKFFPDRMKNLQL